MEIIIPPDGVTNVPDAVASNAPGSNPFNDYEINSKRTRYLALEL